MRKQYVAPHYSAWIYYVKLPAWIFIFKYYWIDMCECEMEMMTVMYSIYHTNPCSFTVRQISPVLACKTLL